MVVQKFTQTDMRYHAKKEDLNAQRHENKTLRRCYKLNEHKKKKDSSSRISNVKQDSNSVEQVVWEGNARCLSKNWSDDLIKTKRRKEELSVVTYGSGCKMRYALLRNSLLCVRGSRKISSWYVQLNAVTFSTVDLGKNNESLNKHSC